jgi:hypothetical protein
MDEYTDAQLMKELLKKLGVSSEELEECFAEGGRFRYLEGLSDALPLYTDSELMKELERRFMNISNLEGNKIWSWMNDFTADNSTMALLAKRANIKNKLKGEINNV